MPVASLTSTIFESKAYTVQAIESDRLFQAGHDAGRRWAQEVADASQLDRLKRLADELGDDAITQFIVVDKAPLPARDALYYVIDPDRSGDHIASRRFWLARKRDCVFVVPFLGRESFASRQPSFVQGFFDGAVSVWSELKPEL